jgi:four helix bundle protein
VSIPSHIAEGYGRKTTGYYRYIRMLDIAYGSVCELEIQILLAGDLGYIEEGELGKAKKDISRHGKHVKGADNVFRKQTLESLTPSMNPWTLFSK